MANGTQTVSAVITADAKPFKRAVQDAGNSFDAFGTAARAFGAIAAASFAVASAAAVTFLTDSVKAAAEAEAIARGLENAAENAGVFASQAGGIKGATDELKKYTQQLGITIGKDDEKLQEIVTGWLAVPQLASLGVDGLENLLKVAADVAAGTGKDLDSIAGAFTKVAGDGETALSKLLRAGIVFTDEQKVVYESLLESNDELGAQAYLIETLGDKYEGAAEAVANPFDRLSEIFKNFQETVGTQLLPLIEGIIPDVQAFFDELASDPEFIQFLQDMVREFVDMAPELKDLVPQFVELAKVAIPALLLLIPQMTTVLESLNDIFSGGSGDAEGFLVVIEKIFEVSQFLIGLIGEVVKFFDEQTKAVQRGEDSFLRLFSTTGQIVSVIQSISNALEVAVNWWNELWDAQDNGNAGVTNWAAINDRRGLSSLSIGASSVRNTYNISVNAIAPTAEVGRAVVDSLQAYQRIGGRVA